MNKEANGDQRQQQRWYCQEPWGFGACGVTFDNNNKDNGEVPIGLEVRRIMELQIEHGADYDHIQLIPEDTL